MGIPGLSSFLWYNRDKISSHFLCNSNGETYTLECKNTQTNDNDMDSNEQKDELTVTKTIFDRKREYIVFDAYSITAQFFSSKRHPFMNFYRIKNKLNDFMDCWLNCGFKLIFVFDGYASWINNGKKDETLHRTAGRYRDIKRMNEHLNKFHECYSKNIVKSRRDNYITETDIKTENAQTETANEAKSDTKSDTNPTDVNWMYNVNDCLYSGYSQYIINIFECLCENKENAQVWCTKPEADQQIAGWVNKNRDKVFAICSSDTDFYVFDYKDIWIINSASIKYKKSNKYMNLYANKHKDKINLGNYINDKNNNICYPCISFVGTKPEQLWKYLGLGNSYEQRLCYTQIVGMDIIEKKNPKNFVEEFELENKLKDVNDRNEVAFAIAKIVEIYCGNKENKINEKIREFYTLNQALDLCSNKSSKDELLFEGYIIIKHMFECITNCVTPIFNALKPIRMMMYKRFINQIKNNKIKEYILVYNNEKDEIELEMNEIEIDKLQCSYLQYPCFTNNKFSDWTFDNLLLLLIQTNNYLNELNVLGKYKNKGNAMILQLKWRRIYTLNSYSIYKDNDNTNIDHNWDVKKAVGCYRYFSNHCMPKCIDLYVQSLFLKCIEYICWDIKIPPIDILFCGPLFHFICQYQENDVNHVLPILTHTNH